MRSSFHVPHVLGKHAVLAPLALITSFGYAISETVWSVYIDSFVHNVSMVGLISSALTIFAILLFLFSVRFVEIVDERKLWLASVATMIGCLLGFAVAPTLGIVLCITVFWMAAQTFALQSSSVLIRDAATKSHLGTQEGINYSLKNIGWMVGPLIAGFILAQFGIRWVFVLSAVFLIVAFLHFRVLRLRKVPRSKNIESFPLAHAKEYFRNRNRRLAYVINGGIAMYWGVMYTYLPLFILDLGVDPALLGVMLFLLAAPLVIFGYGCGRLADTGKYRMLFSLGYAGMALCSVIMFAWPVLPVLLVFITLGSACAATCESTREAYFYSVTKQSEEKQFIGTFFTARPLFSTIGKLAIAGVLLLVPFQFFFLVLGVCMTFFAVAGLRIPSRA